SSETASTMSAGTFSDEPLSFDDDCEDDCDEEDAALDVSDVEVVAFSFGRAGRSPICSSQLPKLTSTPPSLCMSFTSSDFARMMVESHTLPASSTFSATTSPATSPLHENCDTFTVP